MELCPVDCQWGDWQSWSECSKPWLGCKPTGTCHLLIHGRIYIYIYTYNSTYLYEIQHFHDFISRALIDCAYVYSVHIYNSICILYRYLSFDGCINFLHIYMHSFFWDSNSGRFDFCVGISRWIFDTVTFGRLVFQVCDESIWIDSLLWLINLEWTIYEIYISEPYLFTFGNTFSIKI